MNYFEEEIIEETIITRKRVSKVIRVTTQYCRHCFTFKLFKWKMTFFAKRKIDTKSIC